MLKIVTTCPSYAHVRVNFGKLMEKFWDTNYEVDIAKEGEPVSDQLIRIVNNIKDDYFVLLKEDFYLLEKVNNSFVELCMFYARMENVDRLSLQSLKDGYEDTSVLFNPKDPKSFKLTSQEKYLCSLEASIWKTQFLKENLVPGETDAGIEINMSQRNRAAHVLVFEEPIVKYVDAMRGGKPRIKFEDNRMFVWKDFWEDTGVQI